MAKTLSVAEFAAAFDITDTAVLKRIKRKTLAAKKSRGRWCIPQSEVERLKADDPDVSGPVAAGQPDGPDVQGSDMSGQPDGPDKPVRIAEESAYHAEVEALSTENQVLTSKMEFLERELQVSQTANGQLRQDLDRSQDQLGQALESVHLLSGEIQGLTAVLHREQERRALDVPPAEEPGKPRRRWFGFGGRRKRQGQVRIGMAS
jgi:hypothetical protein